MNFVNHLELEGQHAFLSASNFHWINYSEDKLINSYRNHIATYIGTEKHDLARRLINMKQPLPRTKNTYNMYVNDAIGFRMTPEVVLFYSPNAFGTADAISFNDNLLRIHDLKTGVVRAHMDQLEIYTSLFCLEYKKDITKIDVELRIYQSDRVYIYNPKPEKIKEITGKIILFDKIINKIKEEEKYYGY